MKVLGLDLSTKSGYAVIEDGELKEHGLAKARVLEPLDTLEDYNQISKADSVAEQLKAVILAVKPDFIYIEQTNGGRFRTSQKQLEFIHYSVLAMIKKEYAASAVRYVDTSRWRTVLNIRLSKDQRKHNKLVKSKSARGKITPKHLAVKWANESFKMELKLKDNDIADAIAVSYYGYQENSKKISTESLDSALSLK